MNNRLKRQLFFCSVIAPALAGFLGAASPAAAQRLFSPAPSKYFASANSLFQAGDADFSDNASFSLYRETATFGTVYSIGSSGGFDLSGGMYLWNNVGVALGFSRFSGDSGGRIAASLPHPIQFNAPRSADLAAGPDFTEHAVHLQALWTKPLRPRMDVTLSAGPSFFMVRQDIVSGLAFSEQGEPFRAVDLTGATFDGQSENAVGFNVGLDSTYFLTDRIGAGLTLRYSAASTDFTGSSGNVDVDAGGFQVGAGIRLRL